MARQPSLVELRQVVRVFDALSDRAMSDVARAGRILDDAQAALESREQECAASEIEWQSALSSASLPVDAVARWSSAVMRDEAKVRAATSEVERRRADREKRAAEFRKAQHKSDTSLDVLADAARKTRAKREDKALNEAADRILHRRGKTWS